MATANDPYEIARSLGIQDPATADAWVKQFSPDYQAQTNYSPPEADPNSPEAWAAAAQAAGDPNAQNVVPKAGQSAIEMSNPTSPQAAARGVVGEDDIAANEKAKALAQHLIDNGADPEEARHAAGVKARPGEIGAPPAPKDVGGQPDDAWLTPERTSSVGAGAPIMVSPGGRTPRSWNVQEGLQMPQTIAAYGAADRSARDAAEANRDAGAADAEREYGYLRQHEKIEDRRALELRWQAQERSRRLEVETGKLHNMVDAVQTDKIDPRAFFTSKGAVGGFAAAIGYALGALGGAMTHTENPVAEMVRQEIDAQKSNMALRKQGIDAQHGLLAQLTKTFGDESIAEQAAWVAYLEKAKTTMARIAADSKDDYVQANYKAAIAGIDRELAPHVATLEQLMQDKVARQDINAPPTFYGGAGAGKKTPPDDPLFVPTGPNGQGFRARSDKEAQAARAVITAEQDLVPILEKMKVKREKTNFAERGLNKLGVYESADVSSIKSLQGQAALGIKNLEQGGALDKGMQEIAGQITGDFTSVGGSPEAAAGELIESIRRKKDSLMRGQGAQAQRQGLEVNPHGKVVLGERGQASFASPKSGAPLKTFRRAGE